MTSASSYERGKLIDPYIRFLRVMQIRPRNLLGPDLVVGMAGGVGGGFLEADTPKQVGEVVGVSAGVVGVVIAAVVAGAAIIAAFMDQEFLRKLASLDPPRPPAKYLSPFIVTAFIGLVSMLLLLGLSGDPSTAAPASQVLAGFTGLMVVWTITSLGGTLKMIVDFVDLKNIASKVRLE
jgi:hypothetical protein